jgi:uncharacterized NAD(P)/FAD-binding protein YdhS
MQMSPPLNTIAAALDREEELTSVALANALKRQISIDDVAPFVHFEPGNYVRNLVKRTERWELRLLCWRPEQSTTLHGHGRASCAFRILRGSAVETVLGDRDRVWTPGAVIDESESAMVHQVGNAAGDPLLTLHAYSPPLPVDAPSPREGRNVVIIGGGFSGAAVAYHLLRRGDANLRITIVERGPYLGRGVAYGVDSSVFRLNVPASKMSIDPEKPDDFVKWARAEESPNAFLSRSLYGAYTVDRLAKTIRAGSSKLRMIRSDAIGVDAHGVHLNDGRVLPAEVVVLATGLAPRIAQQWLAVDSRIIDAWDECGLATLPQNGRLLILGAGLSALDVMSLLNARNFKGSVTILSRRGLLPRPHLEHAAPVRPLEEAIISDCPKDLRHMIRFVREVVREAMSRGETWQQGFDRLRPHVTSMWTRLSPKDRLRLVRSVRPYWDVLRHRAPADSLAIVDNWRGQNRVEVVAGRVNRCEPQADGLDVTIKSSGKRERHERYDRIVRCIGPALEHSESDNPLICSLFDSGAAAHDPSGLGMVTDSVGRVVGRDGKPSERIYAIGALRRASDWETTAVPDISKHAARLAAHLTDKH